MDVMTRYATGGVFPPKKQGSVPVQYRQTQQAPLAPRSEAEQPPITQDDVQPTS